MIEVMLVEDEEIIRGLLKKMVEKVEGFTVTTECGDVSSALEAYEKNPVGVVFVDIDLGGESGLGLAQKICDINPNVKIVFATAHSEFMADAFEIYAFDYLVKPFNMDRVVRTLNRIKEEGIHVEAAGAASIELNQDKLAVKGKEELVLLDVEDIIFIERSNGTTRIVTTDGEYVNSVSLTDLEAKLSSKQFMRCHRSYIVNISKIKKMTQYGRWTYTVHMKGTEETALMTYEHYEIIKNSLSKS